MRIEFLSEPRRTAGGVEVDAAADGTPFGCLVTDEALAAVAPDPLSADDGPAVFRTRADLFRDILLDKLGLAADQRPDRVLILAADVSGRRF